jgi:hypothetical protein
MKIRGILAPFDEFLGNSWIRNPLNAPGRVLLVIDQNLRNKNGRRNDAQQVYS